MHSNPDSDHILALKAQLLQAVQPYCDGRPYALVDFPNYPNVGDSLLWMGGRTLLRELTGTEPAYVSWQGDHDDELLGRKLGKSGTVFITGGGNTGDLWLNHQRFREQLARSLPQYRIVQLPQSVHFDDSRNVQVAREAFSEHNDVTLFVRDPQSLQRASSLGTRAVHLVPDIAFAVGPRALPPTESRVPTLVLARDDKETGEQSASLTDDADLVVDWSDGGQAGTALAAISQLMRPKLWRRIPMQLRIRTFDLAARLRVEQGERLLAQGEFVRTDRLHAHIMCVLLGIPHEVADNSYGKVRALVDAWTHEATTLKGTRWSADALTAV